MGSFFKGCDCAKPTRRPHPYTIRFRDALGEQHEETGFSAQDDAIERRTQLYAEKKRTAPSVAEPAANSVRRPSRNARSSGGPGNVG